MTSFIKNGLKIKHFLGTCDAVSEVTDFVTLFGVLALSLSIIGLAGYPILKNAQKNIYLEYTRQNFIVLANDINKVVLGQAPSKNFEMKIYDGKLSVTGSSTINITARNSTGQTITLVDQQMRSIESSVGDTVVAYEGTGVWVKYPDGSTLNFYRPLITYRGNVLVIPIVKINGFSSTAGSGITKVTVKGAPSVNFYGNVSNITLTTNSSYLDGWRSYYRDTMSWDYCTGECTVKLSTSNMDVYILNTQLDTEIV